MPRLEYDVVFNLDKSSTETLEKSLNRIEKGGSLEKTKKDAEDLSNTLLVASNRAESFSQDIGGTSTALARFQNDADETAQALRRFQQSSRQAGKDTRNMSKIANNSNQILFSFGDAIQDGAQFQHGFASGARAIGNNLTFASEQISLAIDKAGSFSGAMKGLAGSLIGPAGIVLAVNALVTALTVAGDSLFETSRDMKEFSEGLESINSELEDFIVNSKNIDEFSIFGTREETTRLETQLSNQSQLLDRAQSLRDELAGEAARVGGTPSGIYFAELFGSPTSRGEQLSELESFISKIKKRITSLEEDIRATELAETTAEGIRIQAEEARSQIQTAFEAQGDVIIPADIEIPDINTVQNQFRMVFTSMEGFDIAVPSVAEQILSPTELQNRIDEARSKFEELRSDEGFTIATQQARKDLNSLLSFQQNRSQQVINGLKKTGVETNRSLIDVAMTGAETANMQARITQENIRKISTVAGIAGQAVTALFGKGKDAAIASAIVNGAQAITRTFAEYGFTPFGIGAAAAQAAVTAAQISKIKSTEPGSGGSSGGSRAGGLRPEGFNVDSIERSGRPSPNPDTAMNQNNGSAPINVELRTEADSRIISKKATQGRKRIDSNTTVKIRSEA